MNKERVAYIDILRFIGITLIILAHVKPPSPWFEIRMFDVPLMVFVSGLAIVASKGVIYSTKYILHRIKRLLFPVWLFFPVYYLISVLLYRLWEIDIYMSGKSFLYSMILIENVGYVWIIKVFILIALVSPLLLWLKNNIKCSLLFYVVVLLMLLFHHILVSQSNLLNNVLLSEYLFYITSYGTFFFLGSLAMRQTDCALGFFALLVLGVWYGLLSCQLGEFANLDDLLLDIRNGKYPPHFGFVCYGLFCSCSLFIIVRRFSMQKGLSLFRFIGSNTLWIYLYHIPFVKIFAKNDWCWVYNFFITYSMALLLVASQLYLVKRLQNKYNIFILKYLKG